MVELDQYRPGEEVFDPYFGRQFETFIRREVVPGLLPGYRTGRWWYGEEEIDIVAYDDTGGSIVFGECKWGTLTCGEARRILETLKKKSSMVRHDRYPAERFMLVARRIEGKERLADDGYEVLDLDDIL